MKKKAEDISRQAKTNVKPHLEALEEHQKNLSKAERIILWITNQVGSIGFFIVVVALMILWFSWNTFAPKHFRFDSFPVFVEWALISQTIQLLLLPLILRGQKLESQEAHLRAEADLEISKQTEEENEAILRHLEDHDKRLDHIEELNNRIIELTELLKKHEA